MTSTVPTLCGQNGCRRLQGHSSKHDLYPAEAWGFMADKDRNKLSKAGFATPRGGAKGAYQNHVGRSSKVIIPFERRQDVDFPLYQDGYIIRLLPEQCFESRGTLKPEFSETDSSIKIGENAFVLYRTHESLVRLPP